MPDGTESKICPKYLVTKEAASWFNWYWHYKNGVLPITGGLLDQAAMYCQAMITIDKALRT